MKRIPVQSENLKSIGYDPSQEVLEVEFAKNGEIYQYPSVPPDLFITIKGVADEGGSVGSAFASFNLSGAKRVGNSRDEHEQQQQQDNDGTTTVDAIGS